MVIGGELSWNTAVVFGERVCRMQTFLMPPFSYIQAQAQSLKMCFITLICGIGGGKLLMGCDRGL